MHVLAEHTVEAGISPSPAMSPRPGRQAGRPGARRGPLDSEDQTRQEWSSAGRLREVTQGLCDGVLCGDAGDKS